MNDLLQRTMDIDQEAEKMVQAGEQDAARIIEEVRLQADKEREEAQAALVAECDNRLREQIEKCRIDADAELQAADKQLEARKKAFAERISRLKPEILRILLLPS